MQVRTIASAAGLVVCLSCGGGTEQAPKAPAPQTHTVAMELVKFQPDTLTINRGDSVVWTNKDLFPHTVVSKVGGFDSREVAAGASWTFTANSGGEVEYVCTLHPVMKGVLRVK